MSAHSQESCQEFFDNFINCLGKAHGLIVTGAVNSRDRSFDLVFQQNAWISSHYALMVNRLNNNIVNFIDTSSSIENERQCLVNIIMRASFSSS